MEPTTMMETAAVLFGIAAVGGITMTLIRLRGADRPPSAIAMLHGLLAGAGLTLLLYAMVAAGIPSLAKLAIVVLVIAALIGIWINLRFHSQLRPLPVAPIFIHAVFAVVGFVVLLLTLAQGLPQNYR
jgi:hypothetical protein